MPFMVISAPAVLTGAHQIHSDSSLLKPLRTVTGFQLHPSLLSTVSGPVVLSSALLWSQVQGS